MCEPGLTFQQNKFKGYNSLAYQLAPKSRPKDSHAGATVLQVLRKVIRLGHYPL